MMVKDLNIDDIIVTDRYRKNMGDIEGLAKSIGMNGLAEPIVCVETEDGIKLVDGGRRLEALAMLGETVVPSHIMELDEHGVLQIEFDANEHRKDFTKSERLRLLEAIKAKKGVKRGGDMKSGKVKKSKPSIDDFDKKDRNALPKAAGFSGETEAVRVAKVVKQGISELVQGLDSGEIATIAAYEISALPEKDQERAIMCYKKYKDWKMYDLDDCLLERIDRKVFDKHDARVIQNRANKTGKSVKQLATSAAMKVGIVRAHKKHVDEKNKREKMEEKKITINPKKKKESLKVFLEAMEYPTYKTMVNTMRMLYKEKEEENEKVR